MAWYVSYKSVGENIVVSIMSHETKKFFSGMLSISVVNDPIILAMFDDIKELFATCMGGEITIVDKNDHVNFTSLMDWSIGTKKKKVSLRFSFFLVPE
jgi:hypothetical protein